MKPAVRRALAAVTMAAVCAIASAGTPDQSLQRTVGFSDLDITHPAGAAVLYQRIRAAAREVCRASIEHDLNFAELSGFCVQDAVARAVNEANIPTLSRCHETAIGLTVLARH
jgi:UrcA family protein